MRDVAPGLWLWRQPHPAWEEGNDWEPEVASFVVESRGAVVALDPLAPPPSARGGVGPAGDARRLRRSSCSSPTMSRRRPVRALVRSARYGPFLFWRDDIPQTELEPVRLGDELPGGLLACDDGRRAGETPLYLPEQRALVFADGMTAPGGELRAWSTPWHAERVVPALRALLELPFEHVLVSHGDPVHTRADFEGARARAVVRVPRSLSGEGGPGRGPDARGRRRPPAGSGPHRARRAFLDAAPAARDLGEVVRPPPRSSRRRPIRRSGAPGPPRRGPRSRSAGCRRPA